ncbi:hypothetical protein AgCh_014818 [Apium graveolens]
MAKNLKHGLKILLVLIMACSVILAAKARPIDNVKILDSARRETNTIFGALQVLSSAGKVSVQEDSDESGPSPAAKAGPLNDAKGLNSKGKESNTIFGAVHVVEAKTAVLSSVGKVSVQEDTDESVPSPVWGTK